MRRNLRPSEDTVALAAAVSLTVYSRQNCCLCDDMLLGLQAHGIAVNIVDVDADSALRERYGAGVPVLCQGNTEICRYHLDMTRLQVHLATST